MRKIFSILLALGLLVSMSLVTMPALADEDLCEADVVVTEPCAGEEATYCITFDSKYTMLVGNDVFVIQFPEGTEFDEDMEVTVSVDGGATEDADYLVNGLLVTVKIPSGIAAGGEVTICLDGVINPEEVGEYTLYIWVDMLCCPIELICKGEYTIKPAVSTYKFALDFDPTYPGIAPGFIPPFKACGQEAPSFPGESTDPDFTGLRMARFNVMLETDVEGCEGYDAVRVAFEFVSGPEDAVISLELFQTVPAAAVFGWELEEEDIGYWGPPAGFPLPAEYEASTLGGVHFDTVGEYVIHFYLWDVEEEEMIGEPYEVVAIVHQWKDAASIDLDPKWNLVSLPLVPFDGTIESILAPLPDPDQVKSIWHYDRCADDWGMWAPAINATLEELEEARGYWFRMLKADEEGFEPDGQTLWVFGTKRPMPEYGPGSYPVCEGWNMVGFLPEYAGGYPQNKPAEDYFWNFYTFTGAPEFGLVYGWNSAVQDWNVQAHADDLEPGEGYWIAFERDGIVYP